MGFYQWLSDFWSFYWMCQLTVWLITVAFLSICGIFQSVTVTKEWIWFWETRISKSRIKSNDTCFLYIKQFSNAKTLENQNNFAFEMFDCKFKWSFHLVYFWWVRIFLWFFLWELRSGSMKIFAGVVKWVHFLKYLINIWIFLRGFQKQINTSFLPFRMKT